MINMSHNCKSIRSYQGAATLLLSVIMVSVITLIILFAASYAILQQKITSNSYRNLQAYEAAEAGLEFGIPYLEQNYNVILANPVAGLILPYSNASTQNIALSNGSTFTVVYSNPVVNNYDLVEITSTGTSADNSSVRVVKQLVQRDSFLGTIPSSALVTKGSVSLGGNAAVSNILANSTITSGSAVSFQGNSRTVISTGTGSNGSSTNPDVNQDNEALAATSDETLFSTYFGVSTTIFKGSVNNYYANTGNTTYNNTLDGVTGQAIWIDQTDGEARIDGNTVIGSIASPVILVINGDLRISGNARIYGMVFVLGGTDLDINTVGNSNVVGAFVSTGSLSLAGNSQIIFDSPVLNTIQQNLFYFAKVPGSWKDF